MNEEKLEDLINRAHKMSYLLGVATGGICHLLNDGNVANCQKEPLQNLLSLLHKGIDELYYNQYEIKVQE